MSNARRIVLEWAEHGHITTSNLHRALTIVEVLPPQTAWRCFLDRLLLWMGTVLIAAGLIFFFAYNWQDLGRFGKFGIAEVLVIASLMFVWRLGLDLSSGKAALCGASLFLGALLALIGQTYQTGADTFELFGVWAAMILPWVLVGRSLALWLLWLALVNLAIVLYFQTFPSVLGLLLTVERTVWVLFVFNTVALIVWELTAVRGFAWLRPRWAPRLVAVASGGFITVLAMMRITEVQDTSAWAVPVWFAWLAAAWAVYRRPVKDIFVLAGGVLSVIIVVATFFFMHLSGLDPLGFLLVGMLVITLSAAGGWWLKNIATEDER